MSLVRILPHVCENYSDFPMFFLESTLLDYSNKHVSFHHAFAALFPVVHFTENHETLQHQLQGQLLDVHALGSDFILHQGTQNFYVFHPVVLIAIMKELITIKHS